MMMAKHDNRSTVQQKDIDLSRKIKMMLEAQAMELMKMVELMTVGHY